MPALYTFFLLSYLSSHCDISSEAYLSHCFTSKEQKFQQMKTFSLPLLVVICLLFYLYTCWCFLDSEMNIFSFLFKDFFSLSIFTLAFVAIFPFERQHGGGSIHHLKAFSLSFNGGNLAYYAIHKRHFKGAAAAVLLPWMSRRGIYLPAPLDIITNSSCIRRDQISASVSFAVCE